MPHIHTGSGQGDATVTLYVFRESERGLEAMLHMHKKHQKLLPVGGHIELDETPWQTARHELEEESGYELENVQVLQPKLRLRGLEDSILAPVPIVMNSHDISTDHFHSDTAYALVATGEPTKSPAEGESQDIRWLTRLEIQALTEDEIFSNTRQVCEFVMRNFDAWEWVATTDFSLAGPFES